MPSLHDPILLLRHALRTGDAELASALVGHIRHDRVLSARADRELRLTRRRRSAGPSPLARHTYNRLVALLGLNARERR